ncbi:MAG: hypothetical protein MRY63_13250 [Neomegalonema sp.]|nr:hypothetical protein [Neomegalonema sp.]
MMHKTERRNTLTLGVFGATLASAGMALALLLSAAGAKAEGAPIVVAQMALGQFTTANGRTINLPPIENLNCDEMRHVLREIDATGYRPGLVPVSKADWPLFQYEDRLASATMRCGAPGVAPVVAPFGNFAPIMGASQ